MYIIYDLALQYTYSEELLHKVIKIFLDEYENLDLKILQLEKKETLAVVHKIKGVTLNLGAKELYHKCIELEKSSNYDESLKTFIYTFNKSYKELLNLKTVY